MEASDPTQSAQMPFTLPFLATTPLTDVVLLFWLLPLWWVLGIEQFVWPIILSWSGLKLIFGSRTRTIPRPAMWLALFLIVNVLSGFLIVESDRYMTFSRHLAYYWAAFLLLIIVWNEIRDEYDLRRLLRASVAAVAMSSVLGCIALSGFGNFSFHSIIAPLIPKSVADTGLGHVIVTRTISEKSWLSTLGTYPRVHGMFLYATMSAMATAVATPIAILLARTSKKPGARFAWYAACLLMIVNLIGTTGRMAILGLILGAMFHFWRYANFRKLIVTASFAVLVAMAVLVVSVHWSSFSGRAAATVQTVHKGSLDARAYIYRETLIGFTQRPVLGWGTQRDIPGSHYPAGSHSYYLGILYRNGIIGILLILALLISVWRTSRLESSSRLNYASSFLQWSFLTLLINSASDIMALDLTTFMVVWTMISALVVMSKLSSSEIMNHRIFGTVK